MIRRRLAIAGLALAVAGCSYMMEITVQGPAQAPEFRVSAAPLDLRRWACVGRMAVYPFPYDAAAPNEVWRIESEAGCAPTRVFTYGRPPKGYKVIRQPQPLLEGVPYGVMAVENGGSGDAGFVIRNGRIEQYDLATPQPKSKTSN